MRTDIYQKIEHDFQEDAQEAWEQVERLDAETKGLVSNRLLRAIVYLSEGDIKQFKHVIKLARKDYRDVLWQAEYDGGEKQLQDFTKSFYELGLMNTATYPPRIKQIRRWSDKRCTSLSCPFLAF